MENDVKRGIVLEDGRYTATAKFIEWNIKPVVLTLYVSTLINLIVTNSV